MITVSSPSAHALLTTHSSNCNHSNLVDAGDAGEGNLEILVMSETGVNIPTQVEPLGGARFSVNFTPRTPDTHSVQVTFNDEPVLGKN